MADSIFTKIIKGEIPSYKIYEDDKAIAFLDINPTQPGHTLVVPKKQVEFIWDLEDSDYAHLMEVTRIVAKNIRKTLGVKFIGVKVIGEEVPHAHIHLIPFNHVSEYFKKRPQMPDPNHKELAEMSQKLAF